MTVVPGKFSGELPTAPACSSQDGAARAGGLSLLPVSLSLFIATWIAAPVRVPVSRDFTFKAVIGEVPW